VRLSARVESSNDEGLGEEDASKQGRIIDDLDADEDITLMNDQEMFDADKDLQGEEVVVKQEVVTDKEPTVDVAHDRVAAEEQQELNKEEKTKLFMELLEKRIKFFAAKRPEKKRNRPPTIAQQRSLMLQELFDNEIKMINTFVDFRTELVEESIKKYEAEIAQESNSKKEGDELEQETAKKQKIIADKETTNLKQLVKIILEEDIAIDAIPLAVKTLIFNWKIYKEMKKSYYQIIRVVAKSKNYLIFSNMLKDFDREDVETL
nr:hypothetical protein [Tanacetum cinerariifolium]